MSSRKDKLVHWIEDIDPPKVKCRSKNIEKDDVAFTLWKVTCPRCLRTKEAVKTFAEANKKR